MKKTIKKHIELLIELDMLGEKIEDQALSYAWSETVCLFKRKLPLLKLRTVGTGCGALEFDGRKYISTAKLRRVILAQRGKVAKRIATYLVASGRIHMYPFYELKYIRE